jgi:predicted small integral membrane protein
MPMLEWMAWTQPVAIFFAAIALMLVTMTVLEVVWPTIERKGFLPMATTRGDRLFIGLLGAAFIHLGWLGLTEWPLWWGSTLALLWFVLEMRWG